MHQNSKNPGAAQDNDTVRQGESTWSVVEQWLAIFPPLSRTMQAPRRPRDADRASQEMALALLWGIVCHIVFAAAVLAMIVGMWYGMSYAQGRVPYPWSWVANSMLLLQFPLAHSLLLTDRGQRVLSHLTPLGAGQTLSTTTFAIIASIQLLALFVLWTPSGIVLWAASGWSLFLMATLYALSWLFLIKASWDAGAEVQSGLLGWVSLLRGIKPQYPPMPTQGTFKRIRHPIYLAFALTTWTVPTWTPDQLLVATVLTLYCALGPLAKERRFQRRYGLAWTRYRSQTPFWVPRLSLAKRAEPRQLTSKHVTRRGAGPD